MKRIALAAGLLVVVLLLAVLALPVLVNVDKFRPRLEAELGHAMGREVKIGELKLALLSGGVRAADFFIADDPAYSRTPFLYTRSLTVGVELGPLISSREFHVTHITLDQPQINLLQSAAGAWNFSTLGARPGAVSRIAAGPGAPLDFSVKLVKITNGRLSFSRLDSNAKSRELGNVNLEVRDFSASSAFPFQFSARLAGGGNIHMSGRAGPVYPGDAARTPAKLKVTLSGLDLAAAGFESLPDLAGLVSIDGIAAANGTTLYLNGRLQVERLQLARNGSPVREPLEFDFALEHDLRKNAGVLRRGEIHLGGAPPSLTGTYAIEDQSPWINMNLSGPEMSVPHLAAILPALGLMLPTGSSFQGGTARANLSLSGPVDAMVASGSIGLNHTRLAGFDLGSRISPVEKLAGVKSGPDTEIQSLVATVHLSPDGTMLQDIQLVAPAVGELTGAGTVSPAQALDFKLRARGVPFLVQGTAANPIFRPEK